MAVLAGPPGGANFVQAAGGPNLRRAFYSRPTTPAQAGRLAATKPTASPSVGWPPDSNTRLATPNQLDGTNRSGRAGLAAAIVQKLEIASAKKMIRRDA